MSRLGEQTNFHEQGKIVTKIDDFTCLERHEQPSTLQLDLPLPLGEKQLQRKFETKRLGPRCEDLVSKKFPATRL
ncbi:hypothetical protein Dimus_036876 [Dionaea muscipula]